MQNSECVRRKRCKRVCIHAGNNRLCGDAPSVTIGSAGIRHLWMDHPRHTPDSATETCKSFNTRLLLLFRGPLRVTNIILRPKKAGCVVGICNTVKDRCGAYILYLRGFEAGFFFPLVRVRKKMRGANVQVFQFAVREPGV